jgi:hypothetical protein
MKNSPSDDLSKHRLYSIHELDPYIDLMGPKAYIEYNDKLFGTLDRLQPGAAFHFLKVVKQENIDLFIKLCCLYIRSNGDYDMAEDFTFIKRQRAFTAYQPPKHLRRDTKD